MIRMSSQKEKTINQEKRTNLTKSLMFKSVLTEKSKEISKAPETVSKIVLIEIHKLYVESQLEKKN